MTYQEEIINEINCQLQAIANYKSSWRKAIATAPRTAQELLDHQMWQQKIREDFGL